MNVECTPLPGIGTCRTFTTAAGYRVGVVTHHAGGRRELVHGPGDDPDAGCSLTLNRAEAVALAGLLGILDVIDVAVTCGPDGATRPAR
ncbi:potassium transporter TrkA [Actinoplanes sp. NPDC049316]|uniref:potassium transporter TrkA n=1 Tax=Actinoplanes sp. NPDC049316 TaxID=3154727 RepID=UPI0034377C80